MSLQIFTPTTKDMRVEYPELLDIEEFVGMSNNDIKFCWFEGCRSSPFHGMESSKRTMMSIKAAYGENFFEDRKAILINKGEVPDDIVMGINKMKVFQPGIRHRANVVVNKMFKNLERMVEIEDETFLAMEQDEKKQYISMCKDISATLPTMISQLEIGFSVKKKANMTEKEMSDQENDALMDEVIDEEENNY